MTGAGGGLAGGLWSAHGAQLKSGASFVLEQVGFPERMLASRAVITGEGSLDRQTLLGKAVGEVATRARQAGVPCHAIVGQMEMTEFDARILDFESVAEARTAAELAEVAKHLAKRLPQY
jgi:glycerate kinase